MTAASRGVCVSLSPLPRGFFTVFIKLPVTGHDRSQVPESSKKKHRQTKQRLPKGSTMAGETNPTDGQGKRKLSRLGLLKTETRQDSEVLSEQGPELTLVLFGF